MGTTYPLSCSAPEEIWIVLTPYEASCILVNGIIDTNIAKVGHRQQARHIGIVGQELVAETIHLISIDIAILGMVADGILLQSVLHFIGKESEI